MIEDVDRYWGPPIGFLHAREAERQDRLKAYEIAEANRDLERIGARCRFGPDGKVRPLERACEA